MRSRVRCLERLGSDGTDRLADAALSHGVIVFSPNVGKPSRALAAVARDSRSISDKSLGACQFPDQFQDDDGVITKPSAW